MTRHHAIALATVLSMFRTMDCAADEVQIVTSDLQTTSIVPARIHLRSSSGKPVRHPTLPFWRDHFISNGNITLELSPGEYFMEIEKGPEFRRLTTSFTVPGQSGNKHSFTLERIVNMAKQGWWSGELHVHRAPEEMKLHMEAEDLHVAPVITWWNARSMWKDRALPEKALTSLAGNRLFHVLAGEDERGGGALMYFNLERPLPIQKAAREYPSPLEFAEQADKAGAWIDIEKPFWWDVPTWIASGLADSIGIANNHMCRSGVLGTEAWGRSRDMKQFPGVHGNGLWTQHIYYHLLDAGIRVPPSAGSASGVLPNPVGYNRVYVQLKGKLDYDAWWEGLRAGRTFVTNGPLLVVTANGELPGHQFDNGTESLDLKLSINVTLQESSARVELIHNNRVARSMKVEAGVDQKLEMLVRVNEPGWFLVRIITDEEKTFRFGSTAPFFYGGIDARISRASSEFFADWVSQRRSQINLKDGDQQASVTEYHDRALKFWNQRVQRATVP